MMVLGIDPHKKSHTAVAVDAASGEIVAELTVQAHRRGREQLLAWARTLAPERRFAVEDCRHVSGRLQRLLIERGEACVRVPPKLMAQTRRSARTRGKSDAIDAAAVARAAIANPDLPEARLDGPERELRLLTDHRADLVGERTRIAGRLRWHLHELELGLEVPAKGLNRACWLARLEEELAGQTGVQARIAMHAGVAPLPASSGQTQRHRLNRRGNRQLNAALHRIAVTQMRTHEPAQAYMTRKRAEGKSKREALRCLKRHLARTVWQALRAAEARRQTMLQTVEPSTQPALALAS